MRSFAGSQIAGMRLALSPSMPRVKNKRTRTDRIVLPIANFAALSFHRRPFIGTRSINDIRQRLINDIQILMDRLGRAHETLRDEILYWERGLKENEWDGLEAVQRRVSKLKGALKYLGHEQGFYRRKVEPK